jgi:alpha-L-rhamnosidase
MSEERVHLNDAGSDASGIPDAPRDLAIDVGGDQFAVSGPTPRLSWKPVSDVASYDVEADIDGSRHLFTTARYRHVAWPWPPLASRQSVRWRVRPHGPVGSWSTWAAFEAGLFDEEWSAAWISPRESVDAGPGERPAYDLSVEFEVPAGVVRARLYATALGVYTAHVNGHRAGGAELLPGSTSYDRTLYAQASDVAAALTPGINRLSIELSDGWYRGQVGAFRLPAAWGTTTAARAELHLDLADGSTRIIRTDGDWLSRRSHTVAADLMAGQTTNLSAPADAPQPVVLAAVEAPRIEWSPAPPVRVVESRPPLSVTQTAPDTWVVDVGQNASGWLRLTDLGPAGTRTTIDYGEYVDAAGDLDTSHLDAQKPGEPKQEFVQRDVVVAGPAGDVFEPRHTVHGFQYARITREGAPLGARSLTMQIVHTDLRRTGAFACSDPDLNRLHDIVDWSFRGNAVDVPTDCPTRERLAWTGDYQVFVSTATRLYDVLGFSRKWLQSVRDDQLDDGRIANFSPDGRRIKHHLDDQFAMMTGSAGWGDAIVSVPWHLYEAYGDEQVLSENWSAMQRWVEWALDKARTVRHPARVEASPEPAPFEQYLWDGTFHWGEWTEPQARDADGARIDPVKSNPMAWFMADKGEVGTAYLYSSTRTLARAAEVLGRSDDAVRYAALADDIRDAWRSAYLNADGTTRTDTQAAYTRALAFDLIPDELRSAALDRLVDLIRAAGTHLGTGFLATGFLLPVLADAGRADVAYELLFQRTSPSWLTMLDRGATTVWEDWDGIDENGDAHESLNHYSKGTVARFLHSHTLGLRQADDSVAWESFVVEPVPGGGLTWAEGSLDTPNGLIRVRWEITAGSSRVDDASARMTISADVPPGSRARLVFPDGSSRDVGPGSVTAEAPLRPDILAPLSPAPALSFEGAS